MTRLRSVVAKRLLESQFSTASLTTFNEVDLYEVKNLERSIVIVLNKSLSKAWFYGDVS